MNDRERIANILGAVADNAVTGLCCASCSIAASGPGSLAYFHEQDASGAFDGTGTLDGELRIGYGIDDMDNQIQYERALTRFRQSIVKALTDAGYNATDPDTNADRIPVTP